MRQESQPWNGIRILGEVVDVGVGVAGLTVQTRIRRLSDGLYLQPSTLAWGASSALHTMSAVDASNMPGLYEFVLPAAAAAMTAIGYLSVVLQTQDSLYTMQEHVHIQTQLSGEDQVRQIALRQDNNRVVYDSWSSGGVPLTGRVLVYPDAASALADADPWPGAAGSWDFEATVDGQDRVTAYVSTRST